MAETLEEGLGESRHRFSGEGGRVEPGRRPRRDAETLLEHRGRQKPA
jgi:hypothetical protein